ncbi:MAG TPA: DNA repair protein RecN [Actinomycetota bacterium]|jgi:DNA repair protein RecN (Recombination protein N)|nr:DNA repair protein RecN [Actinomycetota bacterium]
MLLELHISGLGVIDDVSLSLSEGLNVLTGETGAGKTMVTVGLALALGQRAQTTMVRSGAGKAMVEAQFDARIVPEVGEWADDGDLILARTVGEDGRSTARAGGQLAPVSTLAELGAGLVEIHGQHQGQRLLQPAAHLDFLDRFCGAEHVAELARYRDVYAGLRAARDRLARLDAEARERERDKDLLVYQVREIEAAQIRAGELGELAREESRLAHAERILERVSEARAALADDGAAADALATAAGAVETAAGLDPGAGALAARLHSLAAEAGDAAREVAAYAEGLELDPARLEEVRQRIAAVRALERKYGEGEGGILAYLADARARLEALEGTEDERAELVGRSEGLEAEANARASSLSAGRREAAPRLADSLEAELHELGMPGARVELRLVDVVGLGPDGAEAAELVFSGGPGQELMPLARVASGGELSRTMLALRTVLADLDEVPSLVFDEVDAGIGGRAGVAVGRRLARLARDRQVLVVTHLPQIACFADRHFRVEKEGGTAAVTALEGEERVAELSRMLSGMPTQEAAMHAEQLLEEAAREKAVR